MNQLSIICFLSIARTKNFTTTSQELSITQQAVSRKIQKLENELGFELFHRHYHSVHLTKAGERYLKLFSQFEHDLSMLERRSRSEARGQWLTVCWDEWIGCPDWLTQAVREYGRTRPEADIRTWQSDGDNIGKLLERGVVDIALTSSYVARLIGTPHVTTVVDELPILSVCSRERNVFAQKSMLEVVQFIPHICTGAGERSEDEIFERVRSEFHKRETGFTPRTITVLPNLDSVLLEVWLGNGVTFLPGVNRFGMEKFAVLKERRTVTMSSVRAPDRGSPLAEEFEEFFLKYKEGIR